MTKENGKRPQIKKSLSGVLRRLRQSDITDLITIEQIRLTETTIPIMYGLSKIHNNGDPLRPILDRCNPLYHAMEKMDG